MLLRILPWSLLLLFFACEHTPREPSLVGSWINSSMRVEVNADSAYVFEADESNWEERLGMQPIRTYFRPDSTYLAEYRGPGGEVINRSAGRWWTQSDTLTMQQSIPDRIEYVCLWKIEGSKAILEMLVDWDGDGREDDRYIMVQRRQ
jgi:hypothetical protein